MSVFRDNLRQREQQTREQDLIRHLKHKLARAEQQIADLLAEREEFKRIVWEYERILGGLPR